ncbi:hypothetical protein [Candidatus Competibacter phosphatis]
MTVDLQLPTDLSNFRLQLLDPLQQLQGQCAIRRILGVAGTG